MRCVIVANGELNNYKRIISHLQEDDFIICADGGLRHVIAMGKKPDVLIGDLDSVCKEDLSFIIENNIEILKAPTHKNETDTELAISYGIKKNPTEILLVAVTGARLDHTLGNIGLLKELYDIKQKAYILSDYNEIYITDDFLELTGSKGDLLSIMPISETVTGITLKGLEYPLTDHTLKFGAPRGISNVFLGEKASVEVMDGYLLVMKSWERD